VVLQLLLDTLFIHLTLGLEFLLLLLVEFTKELSLLLFELKAVVLVLEHHGLELLVAVCLLHFFYALTRKLGLVVAAFLDAALLVLVQGVTKVRAGTYKNSCTFWESE
jgi:hypothetical protein